MDITGRPSRRSFTGRGARRSGENVLSEEEMEHRRREGWPQPTTAAGAKRPRAGSGGASQDSGNSRTRAAPTAQEEGDNSSDDGSYHPSPGGPEPREEYSEAEESEAGESDYEREFLAEEEDDSTHFDGNGPQTPDLTTLVALMALNTTRR